jgi:hypothetical protein
MVLDINDSVDPATITANETLVDVTGQTDCAGQTNIWSATYTVTVAGNTQPSVTL